MIMLLAGMIVVAAVGMAVQSRRPIEAIERDIEETSPGRAYAYNLGLLDWLFENTVEEHIGLWKYCAGVLRMCCGMHYGKRTT